MARQMISILRKEVSYDPATGIFRWLISKRGHRRAGDVAGSIHRPWTGGPYWRVKINQQAYRAAILAWALHHGRWPRLGYEVDHRDGDGLNNRIRNLRETTHPQNCKNVPGIGIRWEANRRAWLARIGVDRRQINLGRYRKREDAEAAYSRARKKYFGDMARSVRTPRARLQTS
jgi:hypothetical protein